MEQPADDDTRPLIERFSDHRAYLAAMFAWHKRRHRGFSYRTFARRAGFASASFLKLVIDGKRNLSTESIERVGTGLGLDRRETDALAALVELGQADTDASRNRAYARMVQHMRHDPVKQLEARQFEVYGRWQTLVVRELMAQPGFDPNPDRLARRFRFRTRPEVVKQALANLDELGLATRHADGTWTPSERSLATPGDVRSLAIRNFHRQMLERAIESLDTVHQSERNITGVTVALNRAQYDQVVALIQRLRRDVLAVADTPAAGPDEESRDIHQLTFALVPLTTKGG